MRAFIFFSGLEFVFLIYFYTPGVEMSQHFQGPFRPLVLSFCGPNIFKGHLGPWSYHSVGPHQILRAVGMRIRFISTTAKEHNCVN